MTRSLFWQILHASCGGVAPKEVLDELDRSVDMKDLYQVLMKEGIEKFASPQKKLLELIKQRPRHRQLLPNDS